MHLSQQPFNLLHWEHGRIPTCLIVLPLGCNLVSHDSACRLTGLGFGRTQ